MLEIFLQTKNFKVKERFCCRTFKLALTLFEVQIASNYPCPRGINTNEELTELFNSYLTVVGSFTLHSTTN